MNTAMWIKALRIIPRLDKEEWDQLDIIARWLIAVRAAVLVTTFTSATIGGLLAARVGAFSFWRWALLVIGLFFAHATNNLINDLTDYRRGIDDDNAFRTLYGPQPVQQGLVTERQMRVYIAVTGLIAVAAGLPLVITSGPLAAWMMAAGAFFVLFYTWPLKHIGLGEVSELLIWGPLMTAGSYYVLTGIWDWQVVIASLPYGMAVTMVLMGKHIDKLESDRAKGVNTLPALIGEKAARYTIMAMFILEYLLVFALIISGYFSPLMLIVLLAFKDLRPSLRILGQPRPLQKPESFRADVWPLWFSAATFIHTRTFGLLFLAGLILQLIF